QRPEAAPKPAAAAAPAPQDPGASPAESERPGPAAVPTAGPTATGAPGPEAGTAVERLIAEQLRIMQLQLDLMRSGGTPATAATVEASAATPAPATEAASEAASVMSIAAPAATEAPRAAPAAPPKGHYLATREQGKGGSGSRGLTDAQRGAIEALVRRADARTPGSKRLAQLWRPRLADNRATVG